MFKIEGLDEVNKSLETLIDNMSDLDGEHNVSFDELFNDDFINKYTDFSNIDLFLEKFNISSNEDFDNVDIDALNEHVRSNSQFPNWEEMAGKASEIWATNKVFKNV